MQLRDVPGSINTALETMNDQAQSLQVAVTRSSVAMLPEIPRAARFAAGLLYLAILVIVALTVLAASHRFNPYHAQWTASFVPAGGFLDSMLASLGQLGLWTMLLWLALVLALIRYLSKMRVHILKPAHHPHDRGGRL